jgi:predicted transcriptional regulator
MPTREESIQQSVTIIRQISEEPGSGRVPSFNDAHVLKALNLIESSDGLGRQQLSRELGLGEGTVRTLIRRLRNEGLIDTSRRGMTLSEDGLVILSSLKLVLKDIQMLKTPITVGPMNHAILVKGGGRNVKRGIEQRDAAIIVGAKGATTLVHEGGELKMPGIEMDLDPAALDEISGRLVPEEGDAVVIGTADDPLLAEIAAISAALVLLTGLN